MGLILLAAAIAFGAASIAFYAVVIAGARADRRAEAMRDQRLRLVEGQAVVDD
jgi:hypothetical protein